MEFWLIFRLFLQKMAEFGAILCKANGADLRKTNNVFLCKIYDFYSEIFISSQKKYILAAFFAFLAKMAEFLGRQTEVPELKTNTNSGAQYLSSQEKLQI